MKLNKAAFEKVEAQAGEIAQALIKATMNGNALSAQLLIRLAEAGMDVESLGLGISLAERLGLEPQVSAEMADHEAEKNEGQQAGCVAPDSSDRA